MIQKTEETHLEYYRRWGSLAKPYFKWQMDQFSPYLGRRVADIGCGLGNFAPFFENAELYLGIEPDLELREEFRKKNFTSHIRLAVTGDILKRETVDEMRANQLDTVICVNVLEHIRDDRLAVSNMIEGIVSGGHVCLLVPAHPWLYGSLDTLDGHYRRYSKKMLLELCQGMNLDILKCRRMNFAGAFGWLIKGRVIREKTHGDENFRLMNLILPVVSHVERWLEPPIGMSLVMVLRKR